jgi:hypothetical protein
MYIILHGLTLPSIRVIIKSSVQSYKTRETERTKDTKIEGNKEEKGKQRILTERKGQKKERKEIYYCC